MTPAKYSRRIHTMVRFINHGLLTKDALLEIQEGYSRANYYKSL
jgi:hypothetical protein